MLGCLMEIGGEVFRRLFIFLASWKHALVVGSNGCGAVTCFHMYESTVLGTDTHLNVTKSRFTRPWKDGDGALSQGVARATSIL